MVKMDKAQKSAHDFVTEICDRMGLTPTELARQAGLAPSTLTRFLNKPVKHALSTKTLQKIAEASGVPGLLAPGSSSANSRVTEIQVRGFVQAGIWREATEWPEDDWYSATTPADPRYKALQRFALEVRGPSMDQIFPVGSVLFCVSYIEIGRDPKSGERVIVERRDAEGLVEATVKEFVIDQKGQAWLWPRSNDPEHQQPFRLPQNAGLAETAAPFGHVGAQADAQAFAEGDAGEIVVIAKVVGSYRPETD